jgi:hypothetical protein
MKALKFIAVFALLALIIVYFFIHPWPGTPNFYNKFLFLTGALIWVLRYWWPGFKAFSRRLPLAFRFLLAIFLAFIVFMDIKTSGFTGYTLVALYLTLTWGEILWPK